MKVSNSEKEVLKELVIEDNREINFPNLSAGKYKLKMIFDENGNILKPGRVSQFSDLEVQNRSIKLKEFLGLIEEYADENMFDGLESIEFLYNKRVVKKLEWTESYNEHIDETRNHWELQTADFWDNCVNPSWVKFRAKR